MPARPGRPCRRRTGRAHPRRLCRASAVGTRPGLASLCVCVAKERMGLLGWLEY